MEIAALTAFLAPMLPYLVRAGQSAAEEAGRVIGEQAWSHGQALWQRLRPRVEEKAAAKEAVADVVQQPDDEEARIVLKRQLEKLLAEDDELAADVERLWADARAANVVTASGERSVAVGGSVRDSIIITGDDAKIG